MIPVCEPTITPEDEKFVLQVLKEGQISSTGKYVSAFENAFAEWLGVKHAIAVNSGGSALFLALKSLGIGCGDKVIVPDFTMVAVVNAVLQCGAKPILIDCERETGNIDSRLIEPEIDKKTKAIIVVHIYGHPCDMDAINRIAKKHGLFVVEDAAEAHGALYKGKLAGSLSNIACFSFYANKIITTGEGGMIVTNSDCLAEYCRDTRAYCFGKKDRFVHDGLGYNLRMSSLEAALGISQLKKVDSLVASRIKNAVEYRRLLKNCPQVSMLEEKPYARAVYWMVGILAEKKKELIKFLYDHGVETREFFYPMHIQPHVAYATGKDFPNSRYLAENGLYLPSSSHLSRQDLKKVVRCIKAFYEKN